METTFVEFGEWLVPAILDVIRVPFAVPLIVMIVALLKRFIPAKTISSNTLHFVVQVVFWLGYVVYGKLGGDLPAFEQWTVNITKMLEAVVPILLPLVVSLFGGHTLYNAARNRELPVMGYQRSDTASLPSWLRNVRRATDPKPIPGA